MSTTTGETPNCAHPATLHVFMFACVEHPQNIKHAVLRVCTIETRPPKNDEIQDLGPQYQSCKPYFVFVIWQQ